MPSKSASSTAGEIPLIACKGAGQRDSVQSRLHFIICEEWGGGVKTLLMV